ncbi:MAG: hypothetical protein ACYDAQ_13560 [Mycobacteriales bacterium]
MAGSLSYLSVPAHRHRASIEPDHLVGSTQAATVQIGGQEFGACLLETVETDGASPLDATIILRFRRAGAPRTHPELRRYRKAGTAGVAVYTFPGQQSGAAWRRLLSEPGDFVETLARVAGEPLAELVRNNPALVEKMRAILGEVSAEPTSASPRGSEKHWSVADAYAGIEHAGLVVVNSRHGGNRQAAEALVADLVRLRKDKELAADLLGPRGNRIPVTAVVADLADPDDPGRKKAIARTRRAIRSSLLDD